MTPRKIVVSPRCACQLPRGADPFNSSARFDTRHSGPCRDDGGQPLTQTRDANGNRVHGLNPNSIGEPAPAGRLRLSGSPSAPRGTRQVPVGDSHALIPSPPLGARGAARLCARRASRGRPASHPRTRFSACPWATETTQTQRDATRERNPHAILARAQAARNAQPGDRWPSGTLERRKAKPRRGSATLYPRFSFTQNNCHLISLLRCKA